jgi:hypothetical protein
MTRAIPRACAGQSGGTISVGQGRSRQWTVNQLQAETCARSEREDAVKS